MASTGAYRNGNQEGCVRFDRPLSLNSNPKSVSSSFKSKPSSVVATPVQSAAAPPKTTLESGLDGYNGTVMACGQMGTGKTFTLGRLGEEDTTDCGIMVHAMEDILSEVSLETDSLCVSYLQLYMKTIQDLLYSGNDNISIMEDPKTGDVYPSGNKGPRDFVELLRLGEAQHFAANTKLNTESSRSHAILMVNVKRSVKGKDHALSMEMALQELH